MALRRPITTALGCNGCRQWVLRSFIAAVGGRASIIQPASFQPQRRAISTTSRRLNQAGEEIEQEEHALNDITDDVYTPLQHEAESKASPPPSQENHVPWYLQVQPPLQQPESPLTARQKIPELPPYPPDLLQPLLQHVSVELGIDDLSLLDLRALDPPPALGANLLMIIGTARSEKHLHVSADRLCRWLRTNHKINPFADGLLGRNELKLKMRRKAKRSRLLSAVGSKPTTDTEELDDGVRTGWVCVNVGRVKGGELPESEEKVQRAEGVIGFGARSEGASIVVQMMTEEKRGWVDLEKLWSDMLARARREQRKLDVQEGLVVEEEEVEEEGVVDKKKVEESDGYPASTTYSPMTHVSNQSAGQQLRAYHTSARRLATTAETHRRVDTTSVPTIPSSDIAKADQDPSVAKLSQLLTDLKAMPTRDAFKALGNDILISPTALALTDTQKQQTPYRSDTVPSETTPFLRTFYSTMPPFPTALHWHHHTALLAHARHLGHPAAHSPVLLAQLSNMQLAGLTPSEETFLLVLKSVLSPLGGAERYDGSVGRVPSDAKTAGILPVLEDMESCGYDPVQPSILAMLSDVFLPPGNTSGHSLPTLLPLLSAARLKRHAQNGDWPSFWRSWRSYPQRFLPRSPQLYQVLFEAIAEGRIAPKEAGEVVRSAVEDMEAEEPRVIVEGDEGLGKAVRGALEFVGEDERDGGGVEVGIGRDERERERAVAEGERALKA